MVVKLAEEKAASKEGHVVEVVVLVEMIGIVGIGRVVVLGFYQFVDEKKSR